MEYDVIEDLAYGEGPTYLIEEGHISPNDVGDVDLRNAIEIAYSALAVWRNACSRVSVEAERVMEERENG